MNATAQMDLFKDQRIPSYGQDFTASTPAADEESDCDKCGRHIYQGCEQEFEGQTLCIPCERDLTTTETLTWGKKKQYSTGKFLEVRIHKRPEGFTVSGDFSMPNMGGSSHASCYQPHPTRDEALIVAMRGQLRSIARQLVGWRGSTMYGTEAEWRSMAQWCIDQAPPILFGGPDLRAEFDAIEAKYAARDKLRCAALHERKDYYTDERGKRLPTTSLD